MNGIRFVLASLLIPGILFSQPVRKGSPVPDSLKRVILIKPTGQQIEGLPEMTLLPETAESHRITTETIQNSIIGEFVELHALAQMYLMRKNQLAHIEPAYLALTENQGGFPRYGFTLRDGASHMAKPNAAYVDITESQATGKPDRLMSLTQLYPHEMGHILFHLLSAEDTLTSNTKSVDMHFFSVVTDYATAFNEGFAEHIENASRMFEKNEAIKKGVSAEIERIGITTEASLNGFKRDFVYPFRLGFYKASMLFWYQKYEDYKRYVQAVNGDIRFKNPSVPVSDVEDQLTYRNAGVALQKGSLRNYVQMLATEGAVSSFFTHLTTSDLANHYLDPPFYAQFLHDSDTTNLAPQELFSPMQNQFLKYFHVMHGYVLENNAKKAQLIDFIEGYMKEFPSEADQVKSLFKSALGVDYSHVVPPPLWLMAKGHTHRLLVFDPYGTITVPFYTFDLNAAEAEDMLTLGDISRPEAEKVVRYRDTHGFYTDLEQLRTIAGLAPETPEKLISAALDEAYFEKALEDFQPDLKLDALIAAPLKHLLGRASVYFLLLFAGIYLILLRKRATARKAIFLFVTHFLLWILFLMVGLAAVLMDSRYALLYVLGASVIIGTVALLAFRGNREKRIRSLAFIISMALLMLMNVF